MFFEVYINRMIEDDDVIKLKIFDFKINGFVLNGYVNGGVGDNYYMFIES